MNKKDAANKQTLLNAFPKALQSDVQKVIAVLLLTNDQVAFHGQTYAIGSLIYPGATEMIVDGELVTIPVRVYFNEPLDSDEQLLTDNQKTVLNCIYLRHCDGFVRQKRLERIIDKSDYFTTPYLFCLLGEYVIEILEILEQHITPDTIGNYVKFIKENRMLWRKTKSRVRSYWNEYYRKEFPMYETYVGRRIVNRLEIEEAKMPQ